MLTAISNRQTVQFIRIILLNAVKNEWMEGKEVADIGVEGGRKASAHFVTGVLVLWLGAGVLLVTLVHTSGHHPLAIHIRAVHTVLSVTGHWD